MCGGADGGVRIVEPSTNSFFIGALFASTAAAGSPVGVWNVGWVRWGCFQTCCWVSEASDPWAPLVGPWLVGFLLFDFWIVDASIARTVPGPSWMFCLGCAGLFCVGVVFVVCVFVVFVECLCLASYEGHMVDALASRADEGRWSLR